MKHDGMLVGPDVVAVAFQEVAKHGPGQALRTLQQQKPVLAAVIADQLAAVIGRLALHGAPPPVVRSVHRQALGLVFGSVQALRRGHYALWRDTVSAERLLAPDLAAVPQGHSRNEPRSTDGDSGVPF